MSENKITNVTSLVATFMWIQAIPSGGDMIDGIRFLLDKDRVSCAAKDARKQARAVIDAVKEAPDNPWGDDDEAIAGAILERVKAGLAQINKEPSDE